MSALSKDAVTALIVIDLPQIVALFLDMEHEGDFENDDQIWEAVQEDFVDATSVNPDPDYSQDWVWDIAIELAVAEVKQHREGGLA